MGDISFSCGEDFQRMVSDRIGSLCGLQYRLFCLNKFLVRLGREGDESLYIAVDRKEQGGNIWALSGHKLATAMAIAMWHFSHCA